MQTVLTSRLNPVPSEFYPEVGAELNSAAAAFYPTLGHCNGRHVDGDEARISKYRVRRIGDSGRGGLGRLHPPCETRTQGKYHDRRAKEKDPLFSTSDYECGPGQDFSHRSRVAEAGYLLPFILCLLFQSTPLSCSTLPIFFLLTASAILLVFLGYVYHVTTAGFPGVQLKCDNRQIDQSVDR